MKLTIIVQDNLVGIDGEFRKVNLPDFGNVRAVQWDGTKGHIENNNLTNIKLNNINAYSEIISQWNALTPAPLPEPTIEEIRAKMHPLSAWQVRKVLTQLGLRSQVETAVANADQNTKDAWQYAKEFERTSPILLNMAQVLGISETQLDGMFELGATL